DVGEVDHEAGHALPAAGQERGLAGLVEVEVVEVRLVLGADPVAHDLQRFAAFGGHAGDPGDARLDARDQRRFTALDGGQLAGAASVDDRTATLRVHHAGTLEPRGDLGHQGVAF